MVRVALDAHFQKVFSKLKDKNLKRKVLTQIEKIRDNPEVGKPMKYLRKGTKELYIAPYRLSYLYIPEENKVLLLDIYHKDSQ